MIFIKTYQKMFKLNLILQIMKILLDRPLPQEKKKFLSDY